MRAEDLDTLINILTKARKKHGNVQVVVPQKEVDILLYVLDVRMIEEVLVLVASHEEAIIVDDQKYDGVIREVAEIEASET